MFRPSSPLLRFFLSLIRNLILFFGLSHFVGGDGQTRIGRDFGPPSGKSYSAYFWTEQFAFYMVEEVRINRVYSKTTKIPWSRPYLLSVSFDWSKHSPAVAAADVTRHTFIEDLQLLPPIGLAGVMVGF